MSEQNPQKGLSRKTILHIDGDAFFVGVEVAKNPVLKGLPVVTGEERGIVSALSYEAKALGITRGLPIFRVKRDYPNVIILAGDYQSYVNYSRAMFEIVRRYADDVEEYSIDECFADLTGLEPPLKMSYLEMAQRIKKEINEELGLSVSIGLAPNKVLAKIASKWVKPNGLTVIKLEEIQNYLNAIPIEKIWGIGPRTAKLLINKGIQTAGEFVLKDMDWVNDNFSKPYLAIWGELRGAYIMQLNSQIKSIYASVQKTRTFHPASNDKVFLFSQLSKHIEDACNKARYYGLAPKKLAIFLKTKDFKYYADSISLTSPTNSPEMVLDFARRLFKKVYTKGLLYRTAGVTLSELIPEESIQNDLFGFGDRAKKFRDIHRQIDALENKYGRYAVYLGSSQRAINAKKLGTDSDDKSRDLLFL